MNFDMTKYSPDKHIIKTSAGERVYLSRIETNWDNGICNRYCYCGVIRDRTFQPTVWFTHDGITAGGGQLIMEPIRVKKTVYVAISPDYGSKGLRTTSCAYDDRDSVGGSWPVYPVEIEVDA